MLFAFGVGFDEVHVFHYVENLGRFRETESEFTFHTGNGDEVYFQSHSDCFENCERDCVLVRLFLAAALSAFGSLFRLFLGASVLYSLVILGLVVFRDAINDDLDLGVCYGRSRHT